MATNWVRYESIVCPKLTHCLSRPAKKKGKKGKKAKAAAAARDVDENVEEDDEEVEKRQ